MPNWFQSDVPLYISTTSVWKLYLLYIFTNTWYSQFLKFLNFSHFSGCIVILHYDFNLYFSNDSWWAFHVLDTHISTLLKCLFNYFALFFFLIGKVVLGLPWWLSSKESTCDAGATGDAGSIPGSGRSREEGYGNSLQYSCLGNPMEWTWRSTVHRVAKSDTTEVT